METIPQRPGHIRILVPSATGRGNEAKPACGAPPSPRDVLKPELARVQKLGWPLCASCLAAIARFGVRSPRRRR